MKKKVFWTVLSVIIAALSIWAVSAQASNFSFEALAEFVGESNKCWLLAAFICMFGFIWFEGIAVVRIVRGVGYKKGFKHATVYSAADVFFSAITPSASGGQPASAAFMMRDGIPGTVVTVTLLTNLIMYNLGLLFVGLICVIFHFDIAMALPLACKVLILCGVAMLSFMALVFYLLIRKAKILYGICDYFLTLFEKLHIIHNVERKRMKLHTTMEDYEECSREIHGKKTMLFDAFIWNVMQRFSQFGVAFCIFLAKGESLSDAFRVFVTQCFVSLGSNCVPIPGAMGVADYIMLCGYENIIGEEMAAYMEILCRGVSFYGCIVLSGIITFIAFITYKMRGKK